MITAAAAPQGDAACAVVASSPRSPATATVGVGVAFASTLASQGLIQVVERDRALWPYAAYRVGLAGLILQARAALTCAVRLNRPCR